MSSWPKRRIDLLCEVTSSKRIFAADYVAEGVAFYRGKEIGEKHHGSTTVSEELFISREKFDQIRTKFGAPKPGDLLLTSIGALLGLPYVVKHGEEFYFKDGNLTWFRNLNGIDSQFLYYWMLSPLGKGELQKSKIGSAQPAFTINLLKQMEIELPSLLVQKHIAGILSTYDELIENNQRRIRILEDMARSLYREWFIHFRYPGTNLKHAALGKLLDCSTGTLGDLCDLTKISYDDAQHSELPLLDLAHIPSNTLAPQGAGNPSELTTSRIAFKKGDTLFGAIRCYLHKVVIAPYPGVTNVSVLVLHPKRPEFRALLAVLASSPDTIRWADQHSTGTKMPVINGNVFKTLPAPVPSPTLAASFERAAGPMLDELCLLSINNQNLRHTRDLLLPRLLSGQVALTVPESEQNEVMP